MRWLGLYLRSRQVPAALAVTVGTTVLLWLVGHGNTSHGTVPWAVLAVGLGLAVSGAGLVGADPALERTASVNWPLRRLVHVLAAAVVVAVVVAVADLAPLAVVLRDAAGLAGLTALAATVLGRQLAWCPAIAWAGASAVVGPPGGAPVLQVLTWPVQAPGSHAAAVVAVLLGVGGALAHAVVGSWSRTMPRRGE